MFSFLKDHQQYSAPVLEYYSTEVYPKDAPKDMYLNLLDTCLMIFDTCCSKHVTSEEYETFERLISFAKEAMVNFHKSYKKSTLGKLWQMREDSLYARVSRICAIEPKPTLILYGAAHLFTVEDGGVWGNGKVPGFGHRLKEDDLTVVELKMVYKKYRKGVSDPTIPKGLVKELKRKSKGDFMIFSSAEANLSLPTFDVTEELPSSPQTSILNEYRADLRYTKKPIQDILESVQIAKRKGRYNNLYDVVIPNNYRGTNPQGLLIKELKINGFEYRLTVMPFQKSVGRSYYTIFESGFGYLDRYSTYDRSPKYNAGFPMGFYMTGLNSQYFITIGANSNDGYKYLKQLYHRFD